MNESVIVEDYRVDGSQLLDLQERPHKMEPFYEDKSDYKKQMKESRKVLNDLQEKMYAHDRYSMLCVFQAMDAAGKDGTIRKVIAGINPHGISVHSFKRPTEEEIDHEFLWRSQDHLPRRGHVAIFNRSYYEEILVVKVHPEIATKHQRLPEESLEGIWEGRSASIRDHEAHLSRNGTKVVKFFLNLSKDEQRDRFVARIDEKEKNWKFNPGDVKERGFWDDYQRAYQEAIQETARPDAPWFVIPADDKKNMRIIVSNIIRKELESLPMKYPVVSGESSAELQGFREMLLGER
ncbi:MAG: PPK2 family polyphosphate:nucleotide phosphotransferase [Akkermansiaceae bacterium]|jgi:PPK2 family polyphosphate:nucleotide phosphotransferase